MKIGEYGFSVFYGNVSDTSLEGMSDGDIFYTVCLSKDSNIDVKTRVEAEILSRLVNIGLSLKRLERDM